MGKTGRFIGTFLTLSLCLLLFKNCGSSKTQVDLSSSVFLESEHNNGRIANVITATLPDSTFKAATGTLIADEDYSLSGSSIPAGLTLTVTITSETTVQLTLTGTATGHNDSDGVSAIKLKFNKTAFAKGAESDDLNLQVRFYSPNKLNGTFTGGVAKIVVITAHINGVEYIGGIYHDELGTDCSSSWRPQGTLCDEGLATNSLATSIKTNDNSGATWYAYDDPEERVTGVLIIDACSDSSCSSITFNTARVFQMFSDGKTSDIRLYTHGELGNTPPAWNDAGWQGIDEFEIVASGIDLSGDGLIVSDPTSLSFNTSTSRYLKIEVTNDGAYDDGDYIELRSVKLFMESEFLVM
jgi:hypothetical protein